MAAEGGALVQGLVRPCRRRLGDQLYERWRAHLCGLCLTLRDNSGQAARLLTGYDVLLVPVLVEAQAGRQPTVVAGRCALRGMQRAEVVASGTAAMRLGAATALLSGAAGLTDKVTDKDVPSAVSPVAALAAARFQRDGIALAGQVGLDATTVLEAAAAAAGLESRPGVTLDELLAPSGAAVSAVFAQTAVVAGIPDNADVLREVGDAYGRLVHLLDAVDDLDVDSRRGRFNPLAATGTQPAEARTRAVRLLDVIADGTSRLRLHDPVLLEALLGPELRRAISRSLPLPAASPVALVAASFGVTAGPPKRKRRRRCEPAGDSCWCTCCDLATSCDCGDVGCCDCAC